jgi:hypothetical protein
VALLFCLFHEETTWMPPQASDSGIEPPISPSLRPPNSLAAKCEEDIYLLGFQQLHSNSWMQIQSVEVRCRKLQRHDAHTQVTPSETVFTFEKYIGFNANIGMDIAFELVGHCAIFQSME